MWPVIYEEVATVKSSEKPWPRVVCDDDEEFSETKSYDHEILKIQSSELHKVASRLVFFPIIDIVYFMASHVDLRCLAIVANDGKVVGSLTLDNFQNIYQLKLAKARCNKDYMDNFYMAN